MAMPLDILESLVGKPVSLLLKDGRRLTGQLVGYDPYMNVVLEETTEVKRDDGASRSLGTLVLRGNNVVSIAPV